MFRSIEANAAKVCSLCFDCASFTTIYLTLAALQALMLSRAFEGDVLHNFNEIQK